MLGQLRRGAACETPAGVWREQIFFFFEKGGEVEEEEEEEGDNGAS